MLSISKELQNCSLIYDVIHDMNITNYTEPVYVWQVVILRREISLWDL